MYKLDFYGVKNYTIRGIKAYISNTTDSSNGREAKVLGGTQQVTILGPLLFLAFTQVDCWPFARSSTT